MFRFRKLVCSDYINGYLELLKNLSPHIDKTKITYVKFLDFVNVILMLALCNLAIYKHHNALNLAVSFRL